MSSRLQRLRNGRIPFRRNSDKFDPITPDDDSNTDEAKNTTGFFPPIGGNSSTRTKSKSDTQSQRDAVRPKKKKTALETLLEFQKEYFGKRITLAGNQRKRLAPYYPWVELRKRTTPLPSVEDYLVAISNAPSSQYADLFTNLDAEPGEMIQDNAISTMFDLAEKIFGSKRSRGVKSGSVILLLRSNGNTQVIFPGKSTTSYQDKAGQTVQYVWTSSVEFIWQDYSVLPAGSIGRDLTITKNNRDSDEETTVPFDILVTKNIEGLEGRHESNLELKNSVMVAEDYIINGWLPSKSNRTQERLDYDLFYFSEQKTTDGSLSLLYQGTLPLGTRLRETGQYNLTNMKSLSGLPESDKDKIKMNPRKRLTDRSASNKRMKALPDKSRKKRSFGRSNRSNLKRSNRFGR